MRAKLYKFCPVAFITKRFNFFPLGIIRELIRRLLHFTFTKTQDTRGTFWFYHSSYFEFQEILKCLEVPSGATPCRQWNTLTVDQKIKKKRRRTWSFPTSESTEFRKLVHMPYFWFYIPDCKSLLEHITFQRMRMAGWTQCSNPLKLWLKRA